MPPRKVEPPITIRWLRVREHLPRVLELEQAAAQDRRRLYSGTEWTVGGFREFLNGGVGLVAQAAHGGLLGFTLYSLTDAAVCVAKLIAPIPEVEDALLAALWATVKSTGRQYLELPLILDLGQ